jgi:hypothetical protein
MRLTNITKLVKDILESRPETRDDDYILWLNVLRNTNTDIPDYTNMPVAEFLLNAKYMRFPHYESVSRARRKIQEKYPELRATDETRTARANFEKRYRKYARSV